MPSTILVHCRAEYAYPGRPTRFVWESREYVVERVLRTWREPEADCFLVETIGGMFEIAYLPHDDRWVLRSAPADDRVTG